MSANFDWSQFEPVENEKENKYPLLRSPYESELEYFKKNPKVAGMATEDQKVIFNPYSEVHPKYSENIYKNEVSRILMRNSKNRPDFDLTEEQKKSFKGYGSEQDIKETIMARALSGDESAGNLTQAQKKYLESLKKEYANSIKNIESDNQQDNQSFDWSQFEPVEMTSSNYKDVVGEELAKKTPDFEDENEFERMYEKGAAEATRGLISGATLGLSENIPTFKPEEGIGTEVMKFTGSLLPIHQISRVFAPLASFAAKSPIMAKGLSGLANIVGAGLTGATVNTLEQSFKGEIPDPDEVLIHGASWSALDAILRATGKIGSFASSLIKRSNQSGKPTYQVLNDVVEGLQKEGIDFSTPEKASQKALEVLEKTPEVSKKELKLPEKQPSEIEKLAESRLPKESISGRDILHKKIQPETFKSSIEDIVEKAESYNLSELDTEALSKDIEKLPSYSEIEKVGPMAESELKLGENIKADIENQFKQAETTYKPIYDEVEQGAQNIELSPENAISKVTKAKNKINNLKTKPEGYKQTVSTLEDVLSDLGVTEIPVSPQFKGRFPPLKRPIKMPKLMELGRRLHKIIDYDIIGASIKNELKPVVAEIKQEIRNGLAKKSPDLASKFSKAESNYGATAQKFGKDEVLKIRGEEAPEKILTNLESPSKLKSIKDIVSQEQFKQIEREILENAKSLNHAKVADLAKQLRGIITEDAHKALKSLEIDKMPLGKFGRERRLRQGIADDIADSISTGQRPEKTLKLWKTLKGQNLIKQALKETPNQKEILDYLQTQSFYDFSSSIVDNSGKVNFKKLNEFLSDPGFVKNLEAIGGKESVTFFKNLENLSSKLEKNLRLIENIKVPGKSERGETLLQRSAAKQKPKEYRTAQEKLLPHPKGQEQRLIASERKKAEETSIQKGKEILTRIRKSEIPEAVAIEDFYEKLGFQTKAILSFFGYLQLGIPKASAILVGGKLLHKMASNVKVRNSFINAVNTSAKHPIEAIAILDYLANEFNE